MVAALWIATAGASKEAGDGWLVDATEAVTGSDEPHRCEDEAPLAVLLHRLAAHAGTVFAALPVPHEPVGLAGPAGETAMDAGECVGVITDGFSQSALVAVPDVVAFGSALEPGATVRWQAFTTSARLAPTSLSESRRLLAEALVIAVDALESMDVARWRPDAAEEIAQLASSSVPPEIAEVLPPDLDPRRADLLVRAARLEAIAELAMADDGAAVTLWAADQRGAALRHVATAARHAMSAASTFPE